MPQKIARSAYADIYGPTTGDKVRLGDTSLILEVEKDFAVYGDEAKFGGGKTIREGMGQATGVSDKDALDCVITNALIVDYTGIYKADIGIKNGLISGIGKAGNPDVMAGVSPNMIVGVTTEVIAGEGLIITAGGIDSHIHFICPQQKPTKPSPPDSTYHDRRRHGTGDGHLRNNVHARLALHAHDAPGRR